MAKLEFNFDSLPPDSRDGLSLLAQSLADLAGDDLLGLAAFGGWLVNDPFFAKTPARSVAVLRQVHMEREELSTALSDLLSRGERLRISDLKTVAQKLGIVYSPAGTGICHFLNMENFVKPGMTH